MDKERQEFIEYLKEVEGFESKVYTDAAGHLTIGYGHKLTSKEISNRSFMDGLTEEQASKLLVDDVFGKQKAYERARQQFTNMFGTYEAGVDSSKDFGPWNTLTENQKMMVTDFGFNLGSIRDYPKLMFALLEQDWEVISKEYKREVGGKELTRNELFFDKYVAPNLDPVSEQGRFQRILNY